jgi:hypothetical protein
MRTILRHRPPAGEITLSVFETWRLLDNVKDDEKYEPALMNELVSEFGNESVYYDVGSRWGIFTRLATAAGVKAENVHAFEADKFAFRVLESNHENHSVNLSNGFVGESGDEITLDGYAERNASPTVMKMDIEGAELKALRGASQILESDRPTLYVEIHPEYIQDFGGTQDELFTLLTDIGYELYVCLENRGSEYTWFDSEDVSLPTDGDYLLRAENPKM